LVVLGWGFKRGRRFAKNNRRDLGKKDLKKGGGQKELIWGKGQKGGKKELQIPPGNRTKKGKCWEGRN